MLWASFAILCLLVLSILILPILKGGREVRARVDYDIVVYRSQLAEIDQEIEEGVLSPEQADAARTEVHRRMLAAEDAELKTPLKFFGTTKISRLAAAIAVGVIIPVGGLAMYIALGNPSLPGKPYLWRVHNDPDFAAAASADSLSAAVQANPTAPGFVQLGRSFFAARQYEQAAAAYRRAVQMGARDAVTWSELGEAVVMTSGGAVVPEAMTAFANAIAVEPKSERSRFYLGLAEAQIGEMRKAVAIWKDLEKTSPQDAPWLSMLREHITAFAKQGGFDPASVPATPPDPQAMGTAMTAMSRAMQTVPAGHPPTSSSAQSSSGPLPNEPVRDPGVIAMVQRLADKMEKSPTDAAGWQRLAHAYVVIGEADKGLAAAERAARLKPEDAGILMTLAEAQKAKSPNEDVPMGYVTTMRKVLKLEPANTDALYAVGMAEAQAGHSAEARAALTKAQAGMSGDDPRVADIKARLAKIK